MSGEIEIGSSANEGAVVALRGGVDQNIIGNKDMLCQDDDHDGALSHSMKHSMKDETMLGEGKYFHKKPPVERRVRSDDDQDVLSAACCGASSDPQSHGPSVKVGNPQNHHEHNFPASNLRGNNHIDPNTFPASNPQGNNQNDLHDGSLSNPQNHHDVSQEASNPQNHHEASASSVREQCPEETVMYSDIITDVDDARPLSASLEHYYTHQLRDEGLLSSSPEFYQEYANFIPEPLESLAAKPPSLGQNLPAPPIPADRDGTAHVLLSQRNENEEHSEDKAIGRLDHVLGVMMGAFNGDPADYF